MQLNNIPVFIKHFFSGVLIVFILLFILTFPLPVYFLPPVADMVAPLCKTLVQFTSAVILNIHAPYYIELDSDSTGLYIHLLNIFITSVLIVLAWLLIKKNLVIKPAALYWFHTIAAYYLSFILFTYGFSKVFKWQFYLPEPNTLYTTVGNTPPDLLFWSAMGASYPYTIFSGVIEIIPAILLLFRRTRMLGAIIALGVLINVAAINFSYDISVKVFSCFLLLLCFILITPYSKQLAGLLFLNTKRIIKLNPPVFTGKNKILHISLKVIVIIVVVGDALFKYINTGNFNDDTAQRPLLHGAYTVELFIKNGDPLPPLFTDSIRWKRVFIHRRNYFITQHMNDEMIDYKIEYNKGQQLHLLNYYTGKPAQLTWTQPSDSTLQLTGIFYGDTLMMKLSKINLSKLPLLQKQFNWTMD